MVPRYFLQLLFDEKSATTNYREEIYAQIGNPFDFNNFLMCISLNLKEIKFCSIKLATDF
jgi:hypothetical protein